MVYWMTLRWVAAQKRIQELGRENERLPHPGITAGPMHCRASRASGVTFPLPWFQQCRLGFTGAGVI